MSLYRIEAKPEVASIQIDVLLRTLPESPESHTFGRASTEAPRPESELISYPLVNVQKAIENDHL